MNYRHVSHMALDHITKYRNEIGKNYNSRLPYRYNVDWMDFGFVGSTILNTKENRKLNRLIFKDYE